MSDVKIKELDKSLIHQANSNSMSGQRGDISAHEYEVYCQKVMSWNIPDSRKQKIVDQIYTRWSEQLRHEAAHVSVAVAGPARYNAKKLDHSDTILRLSSEFVEWFNGLQEQVWQGRIEDKDAKEIARLVDDIKFCIERPTLNPTASLCELANKDPELFMEYYEKLHEKYRWRKNSVIAKLYAAGKEGKLANLNRQKFFEDENLVAYTIGDRAYIKFVMKPGSSLSLRSRAGNGGGTVTRRHGAHTSTSWTKSGCRTSAPGTPITFEEDSMKRLTIIGLWPDDVVKYCTEKCDCRRYAFDRILYHRGGRDARERICIPVVDRSGAVTTYLDLPVLFLEANAVYLHLDDGSDIFLSNTQMLLIANEVERLRAEAAGTGLKTLEKWFESGLPTAEDYLEPGDEVDTDLIDYFLNVLPPRTNRAGLLQVGGEISTAKDANGHWRPTYLTFKRQGGTWRYAGRCFECSAEPVQKYQSSLERMMLTRCKLLGAVAQEVET